MILRKSDLREIEQYLEKLREGDPFDSWGLGDEELSVDFFGERPHLLLPLGFDESRALVGPEAVEYYFQDEAEMKRPSVPI
jgi:hypothetical protein